MSPLPAFLRALAGERPWPPPAWIMRQAGRYLPEYRAVRATADFLTVCRSPELAAEVTLQPLRRFRLDAAIVFSDIMMPLESMGVGLTFSPGPRVDRPIATDADVAALAPPGPGPVVPAVVETVRRLRQVLKVPLIGFAGAPLTLAAYLVEGQGSRDFPRLRRLIWEAPARFDELMARLGAMTVRYLSEQVHAGAQAVQLFDSWAGLVGPATYARHVAPVMREVLGQLGGLGVPRIYFAHHAGTLWPQVRALPAEAFGLDWRAELAQARQHLPAAVALQGNLDPAALLAGPDAARRAARAVLADAARAGGPYVFNLGHGILPETPIPSLEAVLAEVHAA